MESHEFTIDNRILRKSAPLPVVLAALLGVISIFDFSLGGLTSLILTALWIWAGVIYTNNLMGSGEKVSYINLAFNAAILAGVVDLVYEIVYWVVISVHGDTTPYLRSIVSTFLQAAILGGLASVVWYYYKTNQKN